MGSVAKSLRRNEGGNARGHETLTTHLLGSSECVRCNSLRECRQVRGRLSEGSRLHQRLSRHRRLVQVEARDAAKLVGCSREHDVEMAPDHPVRDSGKTCGRSCAKVAEPLGPSSPDTPDIGDIHLLEPRLTIWVTPQADTRLFTSSKPDLCPFAGSLGKRLRLCKRDPDRNPRPPVHTLANLAGPLLHLGADLLWSPLWHGNGQERLVHRVDLHIWRHRLQGLHHPSAHVTVEGIVGAEHLGAHLRQLATHLEEGGSHLDAAVLDLLASCDHTTVVIGQHGHRHALELGGEDALAGAVERRAIDEGNELFRAHSSWRVPEGRRPPVPSALSHERAAFALHRSGRACSLVALPLSICPMRLSPVRVVLFALMALLGQNVSAQSALSGEPTEIRVDFPNGGHGFATTMGSMGDVDGDAVSDIAVGFRGNRGYPMLAIVGGRYGQILRTVDWQAESRRPVEGDSILRLEVTGLESIGDVDSDGVYDLAVGTETVYSHRGYDVGAVYIVSGRTGSVLRRITAPEPTRSDYFGIALARLDDLTGDGIPEVGIGSMNGGENGRAYVYDARSWSPIYTWEGPGIGPPPYNRKARYGESMTSMGDIDGDGLGDIGVGASYDRDGQGTVSVYSGASGDLIYRIQSPVDEQWTGFGSEVTVLGDLDGDGTSDFAVGAPYFGDDLTGRVYIFSGRSGDHTLTLFPPGNRNWGWFGMNVVPIGGLDGSVPSELLISAPGGNDGGRWYVVRIDSGSNLKTARSPNPRINGQYGMSATMDGWVAVLARAESPPRLYLYKYSEDPAAPFALQSAYPNPTAGRVMLRLSLPESGLYTLDVVDMLGRAVRSTEVEARVGINEIPLSLEDQSPGTYMVIVEMEGSRLIRKVVVSR